MDADEVCLMSGCVLHGRRDLSFVVMEFPLHSWYSPDLSLPKPLSLSSHWHLPKILCTQQSIDVKIPGGRTMKSLLSGKGGKHTLPNPTLDGFNLHISKVTTCD